jgi:hypothetical protein
MVIVRIYEEENVTLEITYFIILIYCVGSADNEDQELEEECIG